MSERVVSHLVVLDYCYQCSLATIELAWKWCLPFPEAKTILLKWTENALNSIPLIPRCLWCFSSLGLCFRTKNTISNNISILANCKQHVCEFIASEENWEEYQSLVYLFQSTNNASSYVFNEGKQHFDRIACDCCLN